MSHHGAQGEDLVPCQSAGGEHVQGYIRFGIAKESLLGTPTIMEQNHTFG